VLISIAENKLAVFLETQLWSIFRVLIAKIHRHFLDAFALRPANEEDKLTTLLTLSKST
jgi:hypothetical protein